MIFFSSDGGGSANNTMGRNRRGGELGVNKKGTPLYSREDIREQYCINDKELQVLDKSQKKSLLGCFSNQGQVRQVILVHRKKRLCLYQQFLLPF